MKPDCVILCGGEGRRMGQDVPKALVRVGTKADGSKEILQWQLDFLLPQVGKVVLALSWKSSSIADWVMSNYPHELSRIYFSLEHRPLGTGGALRRALPLTDSGRVLVLNVDDLARPDLDSLFFSDKDRILVSNPRLGFGRIVYDGVSDTGSFDEKPVLEDFFVSIGWYFFHRSSLSSLPVEGSLEYDFFPSLRFTPWVYKGPWYALNSLKDVDSFGGF